MTSPLIESAAKELAKCQSAFTPRRFLRNAHLQTLAGNYFRRKAVLPPPENELVEVEPARDGMPPSRVLCQSHWQPEAGRDTILLLHGLEGSSNSQYVRGNGARFFAAGWNVVRMNMRNCGGTERECPTLYHSGLSGDVLAVMRHFERTRDAQRWSLVGYSMGGNLVLKLAGEWGDKSPLCAVATVCPAIDLAAGADALHEPANRVYEWHFLRGLMRRYRRKAALYPQVYGSDSVGAIRSLRQFDDKIVAPHCGFRDADDYYYRAASARVVDKIMVPTLILRAVDDPFVRMTPETRAKLMKNPQVLLVETAHGGHCAYLSRDPGEDIHWAEASIVRYLMRFSGQGNEAGGTNGS